MDARFNSNLELWSRSYPKEAILLSYIEGEEIASCLTSAGEENLSFGSGNDKAYFHSPDGAKAEMADLWVSIPKNDVELIYIYGLGLGYIFDAAVTWLQEDVNRSLIIIEDNPAVLKHFFQSPRAATLLKHPQVSLLYLQAGKDFKESLGSNCWNFLFRKYVCAALPYYLRTKESSFENLRYAIDFESSLTKQLLEELLNFGAAYYHNAYQNYLYLHRSSLGDALFGKFKGMPAIICGAGPSLEKNRSLLHLLTNRALIFSGGSATNALNSIGMQPHFCVGLDPNDEQLQRLSSNVAFEVPFFYRSRLNHEAFLKIHAPTLYLTGGGGYAIADYFEETLGIVGEPFEEGRNVITFALEIAHQMGCSPIIFVGMDLAYTNKKEYSSGVQPSQPSDAHGHSKSRLSRIDIYGKAVGTEWKWVAESDWIAEWAKEHPEVDLYNCTEGGIGFPGIANDDLSAIAAKLLAKETDLLGLVHTEVQNAALPEVSEVKVLHAMDALKESFTRSLTHIDALLADITRAKEITLKEHVKPAQSGMAALAEIELGDEPAYIYSLAMFNLVYSQFLNNELLQVKHGSDALLDWERDIKHKEITEKKLRFLSHVSMANIELINHALRDKEKSSLAIEYVSMPKIELPSSDIAFIAMPKAEEEKLFYPNGQLKSTAHFQGGRLHGESLFYSESGQILAKGFFVHGKRSGEQLLYYSSGSLYSMQNYAEGFLHGEQKYYYETGLPKTIMHYNNGSIIDEIRLYDGAGELVRHIREKSGGQ